MSEEWLLCRRKDVPFVSTETDAEYSIRGVLTMSDTALINNGRVPQLKVKSMKKHKDDCDEQGSAQRVSHERGPLAHRWARRCSHRVGRIYWVAGMDRLSELDGELTRGKFVRTTLSKSD
jgi:hypothetical protein